MTPPAPPEAIGEELKSFRDAVAREEKPRQRISRWVVVLLNIEAETESVAAVLKERGTYQAKVVHGSILADIQLERC